MSWTHPAVTCRENGWTVGTRLRGTEGPWTPGGKAHTDVIEITAIGERHIFAKKVWCSSGHTSGGEGSWVLDCRKWAEETP